MTTEQNVELAKRVFNEVWSGREYDKLNEFLDPNYKGHDPQVSPLDSAEDVKNALMGFHRAFPDLSFRLDSVFGVDVRVVVYWTAIGTHTGPLGDVPATNKEAQVHGVTTMRVEDGKVAEDWTIWDALGMYQQLGLIEM
jgi:steroid delta-isomerase-like uncharacterized protein